jgi:hypothetical protein
MNNVIPHRPVTDPDRAALLAALGRNPGGAKERGEGRVNGRAALDRRGGTA